MGILSRNYIVNDIAKYETSLPFDYCELLGNRRFKTRKAL